GDGLHCTSLSLVARRPHAARTPRAAALVPGDLIDQPRTRWYAAESVRALSGDQDGASGPAAWLSLSRRDRRNRERRLSAREGALARSAARVVSRRRRQRIRTQTTHAGDLSGRDPRARPRAG